MLLWDQELAPVREELPAIPAPQRLALAMAAMEWTRDAMGRIETPEVRDYLDRALTAGRDAVSAGRDRIELSDETLDEYEDVLDLADEPGASHLLSAVLACADAPEGLTGEVLYGVLSFCYEGLLDRAELPEWTVEAERANARCVETIAVQKRLVQDALTPAGGSG
ncbi:hypothetical protein [Micromonospora sp. HK10]|uniref:hypothetical protein n=1 Tax=Micromonospora sp. HK10 TaxID=1538294 RepID=UPI0006270C6D|nr:hypothetical protein [Micromonospora sp. HK10]KKJ93841.1 hypothetical protein LQ51_28955 [Micromonospora sp. HK10]